MAGGLTQDFDAHVLFTFTQVPERPALANRITRVRRWFTVAFVESWLAAFLFRLKMRLRAGRVPLLPGVCDMLNRALFDVSIGNAVEIGPGLMMTHGHVVIDGRTRIGRRCQINPWVTIGLSNSRKLGFSLDGPTIGDDVHIGTGAKVLGPVHVGNGARIGANAVVVDDVPAGATAVGVPARVVRRADDAGQADVRAAAAPSGLSGHDERLVDDMRRAIDEYRLGTRTLRSMVDAVLGAFENASDALRPAESHLREDLIFLDAVAATGGHESRQVAAAVDAVERALRSFNDAPVGRP
jgi:serine O-acetyltransferase